MPQSEPTLTKLRRSSSSQLRRVFLTNLVTIIQKLPMLACLALIPICASATSTVPVTDGSAFWDGSTDAGFGGTFGSYELSSSLPSGSVPIATVCATGIACNAGLSVTADGLNGDTLVTQGGVSVGVFFGVLNVTTSFLSPTGPLGSPIEVMAPATVSGNLEIDSAPTDLGGVPIVSYSFTGTGSIDITGTVENPFPGEGPQDWFTNGALSFTGVATVTPEPGTVVLLGLGLAALGLSFRFLRQ